MPYVLGTMGVAIFADLALEKGRGGSNHCGITALSLTEKVHSRLPVKRLRQTGEQRRGGKMQDVSWPWNAGPSSHCSEMFHAQMVSGNSFKTFSPLKLKTWTKHLCINKLMISQHINTEREASVDGSRSFRMSLKVDVPEENDQIRIALHSSDLHCSFSLQSKGPFVPQPPGHHTSPPQACIFPVHIHKVIHSSLPNTFVHIQKTGDGAAKSYSLN